MTTDERASIDKFVINKLKEKDIKIDDLLEIRHIQNKINQIVLEFKTDIAIRVLFNRALEAEELIIDMDFVIRKLIYSIHNNKKQQHKHIQRYITKPAESLQPEPIIPSVLSPVQTGLIQSTTADMRGKAIVPKRSLISAVTTKMKLFSTIRMIVVFVEHCTNPFAFDLGLLVDKYANPAISSLYSLQQIIQDRMKPGILDWKGIIATIDEQEMVCERQKDFELAYNMNNKRIELRDIGINVPKDDRSNEIEDMLML